MTAERQSIGERSITAVLWGAGGSAFRLLMQIGAQVVLARLLGPEQYGVFAIGAIIISFSSFFSDVGLAYGLIQKAEVSPRDVRFVFTWQVILGAVVSVAVWLCAAPIARFFGEPRSVDVLQWLAGLCLINALAAPSLNLLKRKLDFKRIQIAQMLSYAVGYLAVGIPLALQGWQVWALVAAWIVQAVVNLLLLYLGTRHALRPLIWYEQARVQSGYGAAVLGTNLVNWAINNIDRIVVGRIFGSRDIGLYATSYNLLYNPTATALGVVQPVFFSASSRVADERQRIARGYVALLGFVSGLVLPVFVVVAVAAESFIGLLYGARWAGAAALCTPIALAMPLFMLWGLTTPLLWTAGRPAREFQVQLPLVVVWALAYWLAAQHSVQAVAWCALVLAGIRCGVVVASVVRLGQLGWADVGAGLRGGFGLSLVVAIAAGLVNHLLAGASHGLRLSGATAAAAAAWLLAVRLLPALVSDELAPLLRRVLARLPGVGPLACAWLRLDRSH